MNDLNSIISNFLAAAGWQNAKRNDLVADASFRRYQRITKNKKRAILMNAPPDKENVVAFILITKHLRSLGYSAPEIYAKDTKTGLILLEDLGDTTFTATIAAGVDEINLYEHAVDLLIDLHSRPIKQVVPENLPFYDDKSFIDEALLLTEWFIPHIAKRNISTEAKKRYETVWQKLLPTCRNIKNTLVLRDFHADNLMWLPNRSGIAACGLLDYQDAVIGPAAYDLMSLLEDVRRDFKPLLVKHLKNRYLSAFPEIDSDNFNRTFTILAAQRHCKVIGIFSRLAIRDNKKAYLSHLPRTWNLLEEKCLSTILSPLKCWLDEYVEPKFRVNVLKAPIT